jgi:hypothetical protein
MDLLPLPHFPPNASSNKSPKGRSSMEKEYLDLKLDFMFKQLFGQKRR